MILVLHVVVAGEIGGAERMLADLAEDGAMPGVRHAIALFSASPRLTSFLHERGLSVFSRDAPREGPLTYLSRSLGAADAGWLTRLIREASPTVMHLHTLGSQVLGARAALGSGVPFVRTEHSTRAYDDPTAWPFSRWSLARADVVVAVSEHVSGVVASRAPWAAAKTRVIYNGVDTARFTPRAPPAPGPLRLAMSGRLEPRKGVDVALHALAHVPDLRLAILGDGESRRALERLAQHLGVAARCDFVGFREDPREELARCHAVLSASRKEGLGIALLEAMAMGLPAIALPTGGIPEFVGPETGYLAYGTDAEALSRAMRAAASDPDRADRGAAARALVVQRFSVEAMRAQYRALYMDLSPVGLRASPS